MSLCCSKLSTADAQLASVAANPPWPTQLLAQAITDQELGSHAEDAIRNCGVTKTIHFNFCLMRPWFGDPVGPTAGLMVYKYQGKEMLFAGFTEL